MRTTTVPPCYGCRERMAECHGKCDKYKAYSKLVAEERETRLLLNKGFPQNNMREKYIRLAEKEFRRKGGLPK